VGGGGGGGAGGGGGGGRGARSEGGAAYLNLVKPEKNLRLMPDSRTNLLNGKSSEVKKRLLVVRRKRVPTWQRAERFMAKPGVGSGHVEE